MADITIIVAAIGPADVGSNLRYSGQARLSSMTATNDPVYWSVDVSSTATANVMQDAIEQAAVLSAESAGYSVAANDKRSICGGPVAV